MRTLIGLVLSGLLCLLVVLAPSVGGEKKAKDPMEGKKGTAIGVLTSKGDIFIELKADGEEKARKYIPEWRGGVPAQGGGLDKAILKQFSQLTVGSRIEVQWVFHERLRALEIKVLKAATPEKK